MKKNILFILSIVLFTCTQAAETEGYYISKTNDTVRGKVDVIVKSNIIRFDKMTFDVKFSVNGEKFKKIDRESVNGFGFTYEGKQYDLVTWNVKANKQLYLISPLGDVAPDGIYFIVRSEEGAMPIYSLFQQIDDNAYKNTKPGAAAPDAADYRYVFNGYKVKRDIIFHHPAKGYIYISDRYPLTMKFSEALAYLGLEDEFTSTLSPKNKDLLDIVKKYNQWKTAR
ncbi:MAG: hypothetical protein ABI480_11085 [Chitinophagaceae bacterium]